MGNFLTCFGARAASARSISSLADLQTALSVGDALVVVMFYDENFDNCKTLKQEYEDLVASYPPVVFLEADRAINQGAREALRVTEQSTVILFKNHLELARLVNPTISEVESLIIANM